MINFTENLYKNQWLDLVFQNRNKAYGAYALRKHNAETTVRAFLMANILFIGTILSPLVYNKIRGNDKSIKPFADVMDVIVDLKPMNYQMPPVKQATIRTETKALKLKTIQNPPMLVVPASHVTAEPPSQSEFDQAVISSVISTGSDNPGAGPIELKGETGSATKNEEIPVYDTSDIEVYPEFPGGQAAFARFLSRNLRYPESAIEHGVQGKILVSFIIEKNGSLSNIQILRGIGNDCDEEAVRVLSKSPKWTPGRQNQQNVRVAYTIPINFQLPQ